MFYNRTIKIIGIIVLTLVLLNCISNREIQETYSGGGYPSYHPTHK
jgi:transposase